MDIDSINHVGMAVRDLAATVARYESMGFALTPYSPQSGAWKPGEPVVALGSGNRCVMFEHNYLEILASGDPAAPSPRLEGYLRHHEGAHIICFNSENLEAVDERLTAAGVATSGVLPLQRTIDTLGGVRTAKFQRVALAPNDSPEGYIQVARHLTPEYIYQQPYTVHPNGCYELADAVVVTDDIEGFARKYATYLDAQPVRDGEIVRFHFSLVSTLTLVDYRNAPHVLPATLFPPVPGIAAVAFRTRDLEAVRKRLIEHRLGPAELAGQLVVPAEHASGVALIFSEAA
jgi:catechol 2,3-dioxygenase-like lactoylglutathione lyase family enzyme